MANVFITPLLIAQRALATLYNDAVLAALVYRDYDQDFTGKQGDTVNVRVPVVFNANVFDRTAGITVQDADEQSFPVVLDKLADVSFDVTSEEMLLDIDDFSGRLLQPAMEAINQLIDSEIADNLINASQQASGTTGDWVAKQAGGGTVTSADATEPLKCLVAARSKLGRNRIPTMNRAAVISPEAAGAALGGNLIVQANMRGDTDGLVEASIGRKFGFDVFESQVFGGKGASEDGMPYDVAGGAAANANGVAFHRDAVALATRALEIPLGKRESDGTPVASAVAQYKGMGLRVVYDYDVTHKQDVVSVDFLFGVRAIRPYGAVELNLGV